MLRLKLADRYQAFARLWQPPRPRGGVLYLHGIQSHGRWFEASAKKLAEAGYMVLLPDRRGSGRNGLDRGHARSANQLVRDASAAVDELHVRTGFERFHVVGVSWGGKLALALAGHCPHRVATLALLAPGLFPAVDLTIPQKLRVAALALVARRSMMDIPLNDPALFTAQPERQAFIREDELALRQVTVGFLLASRWIDHRVRRTAAGSPICPLKLFLAGKDRIIDNGKTRGFVRRLRWPSREITEYPGAHHTLEFEPDPADFFSDLIDWLDRHSDAAGSASGASAQKGMGKDV